MNQAAPALPDYPGGNLLEYEGDWPRQKDPLEALTARIDAAKSGNKPESEDHHKAAQLAWRMVIELVAGLGIGFGIGYGLDLLFGTMPVFLVGFTTLGFSRSADVAIRKGNPGKADGNW